MVLYVGGDLSRKRLDWVAVWPDGEVWMVVLSRRTGTGWRRLGRACCRWAETRWFV